MLSNNPKDSRLEVLEKKVEKLTDLFAKLLERFPDGISQPKKIAKLKKVPSSRHLKRKSVGTENDSSSEDDLEDDDIEDSNDKEEPMSAIKGNLKTTTSCIKIDMNTEVPVYDDIIDPKEEPSLASLFPCQQIQEKKTTENNCENIQPYSSSSLSQLPFEISILQSSASAGASVFKEGGLLIQVDHIKNIRYLNMSNIKFLYMKKGFSRRRRRRKSWCYAKVMLKYRWQKSSQNSSKISLYCEWHNSRLRLNFVTKLLSMDKFRKSSTFSLLIPKARNATNYPKNSLQDNISRNPNQFETVTTLWCYG